MKKQNTANLYIWKHIDYGALKEQYCITLKTNTKFLPFTILQKLKKCTSKQKLLQKSCFAVIS
ncbi:hypothetical protein CAXC1_180053 [Candidatus Xenohaliotis californiensis]|uniref:Uncharacterized protein n=1 Tax=Candidatus Xenohaliotis californiensis TaxID=84677 RepID=A0ABP0EVD7_9RICK|nr:hypothetical protein CAXC1_180053 [Candidatus Xenohaliotis californiensis]